MTPSLIFAFALLLLIHCAAQSADTFAEAPGQAGDAHSRLLHRIAFGSCFNPNRGDAMLRLVASFRPDQFLSLGDLIYADFSAKYNVKQRPSPAIIAEEYRKVTQRSRAWRELFLRNASQPAEQDALLTDYSPERLLLTLDDHDYGINNGDKHFEFRNESLELFYTFFPHIPRRVEIFDTQGAGSHMEDKEGVYSSHTFSVNVSSLQTLKYKVILLDGRSNKDPETKDFLGAQQWRWLERELHPATNRDVDLVLLGSAIQVLVDDKLIEENWGEFPEQRTKLLSLVSKLSLYTNVVMLSGDVHGAEISQANCPVYRQDKLLTTTRLFDLTSSGLSHTFATVTGPDLPSTEHVTVNQLSRGFHAQFVGELYQHAYPGHYRERRGSDVFGGLHFALLDLVSLPTDETVLVFNLIDHTGGIVMHKTISLSSNTSRKFDVTESDYDALVVGECDPYWGKVPLYKVLIFRGVMAFFGLFFVVIPLLAIFWFVGAGIYYVLVEKELRRRDALQAAYEKKMNTRPTGEKIKSQ